MDVGCKVVVSITLYYKIISRRSIISGQNVVIEMHHIELILVMVQGVIEVKLIELLVIKIVGRILIILLVSVQSVCRLFVRQAPRFGGLHFVARAHLHVVCDCPYL